MPKTPIDYSKTIMYKFVCKDLSVKDVYVGFTTNFVERKRSHKSRCTKETSPKHHFKVYQVIRKNGGWDNWSMIQIEKYPCNDVDEATERERYWCERLNAQLNTRNPNRS